MRPKTTTDRRTTLRRLGPHLVLGAFLFAGLPLLAVAEESPPTSEFEKALATITDAKPIIHSTARWEYGKANGLDHSQGATLRTRFGVQSGTYRGFTGLVEGVNTFSAFSSEYFDGQAPNVRGQTPVADPERTDVNRFWLKFAKEEWAGSSLKGGRQRIKLDDDRWIGNVGWRQNEQTFDAARFQTTLAVRGPAGPVHLRLGGEPYLRG